MHDILIYNIATTSTVVVNAGGLQVIASLIE